MEWLHRQHEPRDAQRAGSRRRGFFFAVLAISGLTLSCSTGGNSNSQSGGAGGASGGSGGSQAGGTGGGTGGSQAGGTGGGSAGSGTGGTGGGSAGSGTGGSAGTGTGPAAMALDPPSVGLSGTQGGAPDPATQTIYVDNSGGGTLAKPTTSISYAQGSGWLSAAVSSNPANSSAPYAVTLTPKISGLAAGDYKATLKITSSGVSNSPKNVPVELNVSTSAVKCTVTKLANDNSTNCGPYPYPPVMETATGGTNVGQDAFSASNGMTQTTTAITPGNWQVQANIPYDSGDAVKSYPNVGVYYNGEKLGSYKAIYSSFGATYNRDTNVSTDVGYDIWLNNWNNEVMIQNDIVNRGGQCGPVLATVKFGGSHGVPVKSWVLCKYGSEIIWQVPQPSGNPSIYGFTSGKVDILPMLKWLQNKGYLPNPSVFTAASWGFELCYTRSVSETFKLTDFSLTQY